MKILIIMDPGISIPVKGYGGHERLVEMFAKEYSNLGHEVHLLITNGSHVPGCVVHGLGKEGFPPSQKERIKTLFTAWKFLWKHRYEFDLIHNFGRLLYLLPVLNKSVKKIMTYGRIINSRNIKYINKLPNKNIKFTAPSDWCVATGNISGEWHTVYNAIDFSKYKLVEKVPEDAPLIFLGRLEKLKGAHEAIQIAFDTGNRLILAGNISTLPEEKRYFEQELKPFIDGKIIQYVGTLDDEGKNKYLGMAKALLFPARTQEAFGMVMIEAMACGTPVLGYNSGGVIEIISNGINGFVCTNTDEMKNKLELVYKLDRSICRSATFELFDYQKIAIKYLNLFEKE